MGKFVDITGKRFGKLVVIARNEHNLGNKVAWLCRCDCGNTIVTTSYRLISGQTSSCGCIRKGSKCIDLSNKVFCRLTALHRIGFNKNNQSIWKCKCSCGNYCDVTATSLLQGRTKSCGCLSKEITSSISLKDITGEHFGSWTVLERDNSVDSKTAYWLCRCECGNIKSVIGTSLRNGNSTSCGCKNINTLGSTCEIEIKKFILSIDSNINIVKSKILDGKEIDIYLPEYKLGIEYNGSAFHASSGGVFDNKDKYYHRDKFILAKKLGIRLITIFDIDYINYKNEILEYIKDIITNNENHFIPTNKYEYTNNDFDDGEWLREYNYFPINQLEPIYYTHKRGYIVYRSGCTVWKKGNTEITH